jgi:hypothetical protein
MNEITPCPQWCHEEHAGLDYQIHDTRAVCTPVPSSVVAYGSQVVYKDTPDPVTVQVSANTGEEHRPRVELSPADARNLSLIITEAAKAGMKGVRVLAKGLRELAAEVTEPEAG